MVGYSPWSHKELDITEAKEHNVSPVRTMLWPSTQTLKWCFQSNSVPYSFLDHLILILEKAMAPRSSTLAWKIPWTEDHGRLQSMGSLRVGHDWATSLLTFHFHALEEEMATHSSVLAWRIPWTEEPGGLPSMGSHRVGHNWSDLAAAAAASSSYFSAWLLIIL